MRAFGFLAIVAALVIAAILTLKNLKKTPAESLEEATGIKGVPANITELPSHARDKVNEALKKGAERTEKTMEGL